MVVSSNGAIMTTKPLSNPTGTPSTSLLSSCASRAFEFQHVFFFTGSPATYTRPSVNPALAARVATSPVGATYVKTTSGSIITVVPKSLATLGGKIITTNMVTGEREQRGRLQAVELKISSLIRIVLCHRNHNKDHHHPHDLQTQRDRGAEDHWKRNHSTGTSGKERGYDAVKRRGKIT